MAGDLIGALLYLRSRSLLNLVASRLRRLRQPKYVAGAVIGIAYLYFVFGRRLPAQHGSRPAGAMTDLPDAFGLASTLGAIAILVFFALCWVLRRQRAAPGFSDAEIAFLFPAPASRRALIHYRIISLGIAGTFTALIFALLSARWGLMPGNFAMRMLGWWLVFSTISLHTLGSAFTLTRWLDRGASPLRCQLVAVAVAALVIGLPVLWLSGALQAGLATWTSATQTGPVAWLLLPFRLMVAPLLAADGRAFVLALGPALLIYAAHYLWVLQVQVGFEEASIAKAEKRAATLAAMRAGNWRLGAGRQKARPAPFDLSRAPRPELAFLWKNLLSTAGYLRPRNALIAGALIVGACLGFADSGFFQAMRPALGAVSLILAGYTLVFGPQLARQDLRSDLANTDILKTYPLRGWQVVLGEMLAPAVILTGLLWLMLLAAAMLFDAGAPRMAWLTPGLRTGIALGLALLAPLLSMAQLVIVNAAAVLYPAWHPAPGQPQQGIEVMGQRILFFAAQLFAMGLMLLPAVVVGAVGFAAIRWVAGDVAGGVVSLLLGAAVLVVELGLAIAWLGERFERLDLSLELRP